MQSDFSLLLQKIHAPQALHRGPCVRQTLRINGSVFRSPPRSQLCCPTWALQEVLWECWGWAEGQGVEVHGKGDWCLQVKALRAPLPVAWTEGGVFSQSWVGLGWARDGGCLAAVLHGQMLLVSSFRPLRVEGPGHQGWRRMVSSSVTVHMCPSDVCSGTSCARQPASDGTLAPSWGQELLGREHSLAVSPEGKPTTGTKGSFQKGKGSSESCFGWTTGDGAGGVAAQTLRRERGQLGRARDALGRLGGFRGLFARQLQFALLLEGQEHALLFTLAAGLLWGE